MQLTTELHQSCHVHLHAEFDYFDMKPSRSSRSSFSMHPSAVSTSARTTAEIAFDHSRIALQAGGIVRQDDPAGFDHITAFRQGKGDARVLLDEQDRHSRT